MTKLIRIKEGKTVTVYDDSSVELMESLGVASIKRATHVDFSNDLRLWVATLADLGEDNFGVPGTVIACCKTRKEAIDAEIAYLKIHMGFALPV